MPPSVLKCMMQFSELLQYLSAFTVSPLAKNQPPKPHSYPRTQCTYFLCWYFDLELVFFLWSYLLSFHRLLVWFWSDVRHPGFVTGLCLALKSIIFMILLIEKLQSTLCVNQTSFSAPNVIIVSINLIIYLSIFHEEHFLKLRKLIRKLGNHTLLILLNFIIYFPYHIFDERRYYKFQNIM